MSLPPITYTTKLSPVAEYLLEVAVSSVALTIATNKTVSANLKPTAIVFRFRVQSAKG